MEDASKIDAEVRVRQLFRWLQVNVAKLIKYLEKWGSAA